MKGERIMLYEKTKKYKRNKIRKGDNLIMSNVERFKILELVQDWDLWPRYDAESLDATNISRFKEAIRSGKVLPPIIADKKSYRIIDGFHRVRAYLSVYGDGAEAEVEFINYKNDTEMFMDAAKRNNEHGLPLSPKDKVHVILKARRLRVPIAKIGEILGMTKERIKEYEDERTATIKSTGQKIPLSAGARSMAGRSLNKKEEKFAREQNGILPIVQARLLLNALRASACPLTDKEIAVLVELRDAIDIALSKKKKAA